MAKKRSNAKKKTNSKTRYTFQVHLVSGLMTEEFIEENPKVHRTIEMRGDQTLAQLHETIFDAFDRYDEHMYEFQFGKKPMDADARRYVLPFGMDEEDEPAGTVAIRLDDLGISNGEKFFYWFDFGDDWWHVVEVKSISEVAPRVRYPKVTDQVGQSPPQYPGLDEDEFDDFGEEFNEEEFLDGLLEAGEEREFASESTADAACLVAEMHLKNQEYSKAIEAFTRAIEMTPSIDAYQGRAKACRALAEQDEAFVKQMK